MGDRLARAPKRPADSAQSDTALVRAFREQLGVTAWRGRATGSWWALVQTMQPVRLLEAEQPQALATAIRRLYGWEGP